MWKPFMQVGIDTEPMCVYVIPAAHELGQH